MITDRSIDLEVCPVPLDLLGRVYRADADTLSRLIADIPERKRARLAAYLYGRSHTHELGLKVAAACTMAALRTAEGPLGEAIHAQSRRSYAPPTHGESRPASVRKITLAGSRLGASLVPERADARR